MVKKVVKLRWKNKKMNRKKPKLKEVMTRMMERSNPQKISNNFCNMVLRNLIRIKMIRFN